ncbi:MAG: methionyl-tRNA formyltransferase [Ignavibacteriales bacterium]|nr:methionyl-tRNA formyltransferase [Ignavibacteriales bacterium]
MRILFMGTPEFAVPSLRILLDHSYEVAGVVTAPDKPRGRGQHVSSTPIKEFALQHHLTILQPGNLKDLEFVSDIQQFAPDLVVVVAFRILPREVYTIPKLGTFNLHASLLPKYRGAAPINWAIMNGEKESGVSTFFLQDKVDTGSILLQARAKIGEDETAGELHDTLSEVGAEVVLQTVRLIELGKAQPRLQNDALACAAPKIFKNDCRIDWKKSSQQVHNFIRGLSPSPASWTMHNDKTLKLYSTKISEAQSQAAGIVLQRTNDTLLVGTGNGTVSILEIQQEGKRRLGIEEFLRGYKIEAGEVFE